jgi:TraB/PrgY/gumN family
MAYTKTFVGAGVKALGARSPMRVPSVVFAAALLIASVAIAQTPPPPPSDAATSAADASGGSVLLESLEVIAHPVGPAMWRAQLGGGEVIILGSVTPIHHQQAWDDRRVRRALAGARLLLTPVEAKASAGGVAAFLTRDAFRVRTLRGDLEKGLPPDLRARFVSARDRAKVKADRYAKWKPAVAGALLLTDFRAAQGVSEAKPANQVEDLAKAAGVPVRAMAELPISGLMKAAGDLNDAQQITCLRAFLSQLEFEGGRPGALGKAWSVGDLAGVRRNYPSQAYETCLGQVSGGQALREKAVADSTATLLAALRSPGKTVAIIDLGQLQRRDGVLDRLQAAGATITVPPDA